MIPWSKIAIGLIGAIVIAAGSAIAGWHFCALGYEARIASDAAKAANTQLADVLKRTDATMKVAQAALDAKWRTQTNTVRIVEKVPVYVPKEVDRPVNVGFVRLFNAAAGGYALPDAAGGDNAAPSSVVLSTVAGTTAENFGVCRENAAQLTAAQDWIRAQLALNPP